MHDLTERDWVAQAVQKQVSLDNMRQQAAAANARGQEVRSFPVSSPAYACRMEPGVGASKCLHRALSLAVLHLQPLQPDLSWRTQAGMQQAWNVSAEWRGGGGQAERALRDAGLVPAAGEELTMMQRTALESDLSGLSDLSEETRAWLLVGPTVSPLEICGMGLQECREGSGLRACAFALACLALCLSPEA